MMNLDKIYFVTLEIIINEGILNAYDENIPVFEDGAFLCLMKYLLKLFPILLKQSGIFDYLIEKLLNKRWGFNGRTSNLTKKETGHVYTLYSLAFIGYLISGTNGRIQTLKCFC